MAQAKPQSLSRSQARPAPVRSGKHPGGRPTKLTPEVQATIVNALASGTYLETAAAAAGINQATLHRWLREGARSRNGKQKEFCEAVKKALASAEVGFAATIVVAARRRWQAAAWLLERRYPQRWSLVERHELTGEGGGPLEVRVVYDEPISPGLKVAVEPRDLPELE